jgi:hypothetical protein
VEFTRRLDQHLPPRPIPLAIEHPDLGQLRWNRETLELPHPDAQQLVVFLAADNATTTALDRLHRSGLRAV